MLPRRGLRYPCARDTRRRQRDRTVRGQSRRGRRHRGPVRHLAARPHRGRAAVRRVPVGGDPRRRHRVGGSHPPHRPVPVAQPGGARRLPARARASHACPGRREVRRTLHGRTPSAGAPGGVHPRRVLDRELPQLRRGAARPALLALRSAREGAGALARHAAARPARRHHELRLAHLAHAEAAGVQPRHAHGGIPARAGARTIRRRSACT